jgi:diguanylate cyclase
MASPPASLRAPLRGERLARALWACGLAAGLLVFAGSTVWRMATREHVVAFFDHWLYNGLLVAIAVFALWRPARVAEHRGAWLAIGAGVACNAGGGIYTAFLLGGDANAPYPSWADALYLGAYPCIYLGLVLLARPHVKRLRLTLWLDGAIAVLGASTIVAALVLDHVIDTASGRLSAVVTTLTYPVADTMLLCLVITAASLCGRRLGRAWWVIAGGICLFACSDLLYAWQEASDTYQEGTLLDVGWPAGFATVAAAAWIRSRPLLERAAGGMGGALAVPALFTLAALAILATGTGGVSATVLAVLTLLAAAVRIGLAFRELQLLDEARAQAITDELTGLGNRRLLMRRLEQAIADEEAISLLVIDLDGF